MGIFNHVFRGGVWIYALHLGMHSIGVCIALAFIVHKFIQKGGSGLENHGRNSPDPAGWVWIITKFHPLICHIPC